MQGDFGGAERVFRRNAVVDGDVGDLLALGNAAGGADIGLQDVDQPLADLDAKGQVGQPLGGLRLRFGAGREAVRRGRGHAAHTSGCHRIGRASWIFARLCAACISRASG